MFQECKLLLKENSLSKPYEAIQIVWNTLATRTLDAWPLIKQWCLADLISDFPGLFICTYLKTKFS